MSRLRSLRNRPSPKLYHHIKDLPLYIFIECYCENNFSALVISGTPDENQLSESWACILEEYSDAVGGTDLKGRLSLAKRVIILGSKINRAQLIMKIASISGVNDNIYGWMKTFGYPLPSYNNSNGESIIKAFEGHVKLEIVNLEETKRELNKTQTNKGITRDNFMDIIADIGTHLGVVIDEMNCTTEKYCAFVRRYQKKIDHIIKQSRKHGTGLNK